MFPNSISITECLQRSFAKKKVKERKKVKQQSLENIIDNFSLRHAANLADIYKKIHNSFCLVLQLRDHFSKQWLAATYIMEIPQC